MWQALIKLVEKWSYRCDHSFERISKNSIYENDYDKLPHTVTASYMCMKCGKHKKIKLI